jgi:hypothetical protein
VKNASVVDENIHSSEGLGDLRHRGFDRLCVPIVGTDGDRLAAAALDRTNDAIGLCASVDIGERHGRSAFGELCGDRGSDSPAAASHQCCFSLKGRHDDSFLC